MNRKYKKILNCYRLFIAQARRLRQQEKGNVKKNPPAAARILSCGITAPQNL